MKVVRGLLLVLLALIVVLGIVGLFLPTSAHVERSASVNATVAEVYAVVSDLRRFNEWSPWAGLDPNARFTYDGSGAGSRMSWASEERSVGVGSMTITALTPNERVDLALDFSESDKATSFIALTPDGANTTVTWGFDAEFGFFPYYRYFGLLMDTLVGREYEKGLSDLKALLEKR